MFDKILFFMTPMCPNCGEIHDWLEDKPEVMEKCEEVDATTKEGLEKAKMHAVTGVPTLLLLKAGKKVGMARNLDDFQKLLDNRSLADF